MGSYPPIISSQQPVDLGGGFEDPMDPCTMCMQGQQEIQQAYNDLQQSCNACQTQQNLTQLQQQGCQGCAQAQQVIQKVQNQSQGCASCGTQQTMFTQMQQPQPSSQQTQFSNLNQTGGQMPMSSQGSLVQPMLTPLVGTQNQILTTVGQQPGMMAGQLPIQMERGPMTMQQPMISTGGTQTTQPMVVGGMMTQPMTTTQPMLLNTIGLGVGQSSLNIPSVGNPSQGFTATGLSAPGGQNVLNVPSVGNPSIGQGGTAVSAPGGQNVLNLPSVGNPSPPQTATAVTPTPMQTGAPGFSFPSAQQLATAYNVGITGVGAATQGYGAGGGKAGPGAGGGVTVGNEGQLSYAFNIAAGPGVGNTGVGGLVGGFGPGAFDTHRPDLHAGGPWHNLLPAGAIENVFNLL